MIELFLAELDKVETVTEFHEDTWYALLDYVTVYDIKRTFDSPLKTERKSKCKRK